MTAVRQGQLVRAQELLAAGADVNAADVSGRTPLLMAATVDNLQLVQLLLEAGANIHAVDNGGQTALHTSAATGHAHMVQLLLAAGANIDAADSGGITPLHRAAEHGHYEVMQLLLKRGANPQLCAQSGGTVLQTAAIRGHKSIVQLLLDSWRQPQMSFADLGRALASAPGKAFRIPIAGPYGPIIALLAKELRKLHPAEFNQHGIWLMYPGYINSAAAAAKLAAMLDEWASDVGSLDEQRAALSRREEDVKSEQQAVQRLIVAVADMARQRAVPQQPL